MTARIRVSPNFGSQFKWHMRGFHRRANQRELNNTGDREQSKMQDKKEPNKKQEFSLKLVRAVGQRKILDDKRVNLMNRGVAKTR